MAKFIEVTNRNWEPCLINTEHIQMVHDSTIYFDDYIGENQDYLIAKESFEELKEKILNLK